jgi:hypothetical protein
MRYGENKVVHLEKDNTIQVTYLLVYLKSTKKPENIMTQISVITTAKIKDVYPSKIKILFAVLYVSRYFQRFLCLTVYTCYTTFKRPSIDSFLKQKVRFFIKYSRLASLTCGD